MSYLILSEFILNTFYNALKFKKHKWKHTFKKSSLNKGPLRVSLSLNVFSSVCCK